MNRYVNMNPEELEEHFSNYLINYWSYSSAATFSRNEKEFERRYIYHDTIKESAASVAGSAYHSALEEFFLQLNNDGSVMPVEVMEQIAYNYIDNVEANKWKIQKTTPTIEDCKISATKIVTALIRNFLKEKETYLGSIKEVMGVEVACEEWISLNGVDIPLPCHARIDMIVKTTDDKVVIIDHKSVRAFTDASEVAFVRSKQAIVYTLNYESMTDHKVDEVWFIENKYAQNKDGGPQLIKNKIVMDHNTRRLYEALLYESVKRMVEAVSDPDYVYTINDNDSLCDRAELYSFWAKTMIADIDNFDIPEDKKELVKNRKKKIRDASLGTISPKVIQEFEKNAAAFITYDLSSANMTNAEKIEHILRTFHIVTKVAHTIEGYSSNTYLVEVSAGVKMDTISKYKLDIAAAISVPNIRIAEDLYVYDGKAYLAIEANHKREKNLDWDKKYQAGSNIPIGIDNFGNVINWDINIHSTPHVLVCGATGSGKSVCIRSTIEYAKCLGMRIIVFDPKYEFCGMSGVTVYNDIDDIEEMMRGLVVEMQARAKSGLGLRPADTLIVFDEFADAVAQSHTSKELDGAKTLEENLKMLLQKGRSLGYRIIAATQRASTKVITGDAKVNFPVQICFRVPKEIDSKVVLDEAGAETLSGCGDGLIKSPEYMHMMRFQGFYI